MRVSLLLLQLCTIVIHVNAADRDTANEPVFELNAAARHALVEMAVTFKKGDSYDAVIRKLGKPNAEVSQRESQPLETVGYIAHYWLKHFAPKSIYQDQVVSFWFDRERRIEFVVISATLE